MSYLCLIAALQPNSDPMGSVAQLPLEDALWDYLIEPVVDHFGHSFSDHGSDFMVKSRKIVIEEAGRSLRFDLRMECEYTRQLAIDDPGESGGVDVRVAFDLHLAGDFVGMFERALLSYAIRVEAGDIYGTYSNNASGPEWEIISAPGRTVLLAETLRAGEVFRPALLHDLFEPSVIARWQDQAEETRSRKGNCETKQKQLRFRADGIGPLASPIETDPALIDWQSFVPIFHHGIFNPFGPTWNLVGLVDLKQESQDKFICWSSLNPFARTDWVIAVIHKFDEREHREIGKIATESLSIQACANSELLHTPPTWVHWDPDGGATFGGMAREFFEGWVRASKTSLATDLARMRKFAGRPWDRASDELHNGLRTALTDLAATSDDEANGGCAVDLEKFSEWWECVTGEMHLKSELAAMFRGWHGAIEHSVVTPTVSFRELISLLADVGFDVRRYATTRSE